MQDLEVTRLAAALGAEISGLDLSSADEAMAGKIEELLLEHGVLFFPDQHLTPDAHLALGSLFGEVERHPHLENPTPGLPDGLFELAASHGGVADEWHTDLTCLAEPALYSILHIVRAPSIGGDTMWANTAAAYEALSPPIQELCDGLTAIHDGTPNDAPGARARHPVVRVHPATGKRVLYVNEHFTRRIVELSHDESQLLLGHLTKWVSQPRFTVRYRWTEGTVAMWDNRATQHFVLGDFTEERVIQRVSIMGDQIEGIGQRRWPSFTRSGVTSDTSRHDAILKGIEEE